jgi:CRP-like cAMP-binding protein
MRNFMADQSPMLPFMRRLCSHSRLTNEEQDAILNLAFEPLKVAPNQDFIKQNEPVNRSCFVHEGLVATFGQNHRGERQISSFFLAGDMIDLNTVVVPEALSSIQALTPTTILQFPHSSLREIARQHPGIAEAFWRECVLTATIVAEWVTNVGRRDARSRIAHLLCEIGCRGGRKPEEGVFTFDFPITQNQLADMVGLTPVHVNRTLMGLREDGLVHIEQRRAHITNWKRLAEIGDFDPAYLRNALAEAPLRIVAPPSQTGL